MATLAALCADPDPGVRRSAVHAYMWHYGSMNPTNALAQLALQDPDPEVRGQALEALAARWAWADRRAPGFLHVRRAVTGGLAAEHAVVRFWAVYAVGQLELSAERSRVAALLDDQRVGFADLTVADEARSVLADL